MNHEMFRKIAFVGNSGVGKTIRKLVESKRSIDGSMKQTIIDEMKDPNYRRITIGAAFISILRNHANPFISNTQEIRYHIWDTAGQERYHSLVPMLIRGCYAIIAMYDITVLQSWKDLKSHWVPFIEDNIGNMDNVGLANGLSMITIVGTRLDKRGARGKSNSSNSPLSCHSRSSSG